MSPPSAPPQRRTLFGLWPSPTHTYTPLHTPPGPPEVRLAFHDAFPERFFCVFFASRAWPMVWRKKKARTIGARVNDRLASRGRHQTLLPPPTDGATIANHHAAAGSSLARALLSFVCFRLRRPRDRLAAGIGFGLGFVFDSLLLFMLFSLLSLPVSTSRPHSSSPLPETASSIHPSARTASVRAKRRKRPGGLPGQWPWTTTFTPSLPCLSAWRVCVGFGWINLNNFQIFFSSPPLGLGHPR